MIWDDPMATEYDNMIDSDEERDLWKQIDELEHTPTNMVPESSVVNSKLYVFDDHTHNLDDDKYSLFQRHRELWDIGYDDFVSMVEDNQLPEPLYHNNSRFRRSCALTIPNEPSTFIEFLYFNRTLLKYETPKQIEDFYYKISRINIVPEVSNRPRLSLKIPGVEVEMCERDYNSFPSPTHGIDSHVSGVEVGSLFERRNKEYLHSPMAPYQYISSPDDDDSEEQDNNLWFKKRNQSYKI